MIKRLTHRAVHVQVPRDLYLALLVEGERSSRSMGDILFPAESEDALRRRFGIPRPARDEQPMVRN